MNLVDFLNEKINFNKAYSVDSVSRNYTYNKLLEEREELKKCDDFKNVTDLNFLDKNYIVNQENDLIKSTTINLSFDAYSGAKQTIEFGKRCYISSIETSPINEFSKPDNLENYITPYKYRVFDFSEYREIVLNFSDGDTHDDIMNRLKNILNNQEEFMLKRNVNIKINGFFEYVKIDDKEYSFDLGAVNLESNKYTQFRCVTIDTINNEKRLGVDKVYVPTEHLQSIQEYANKIKPDFFTRERLNEYFEKNNINFKIIENNINNKI